MTDPSSTPRVPLQERPFARWAPPEAVALDVPAHALAWLSERLGPLEPRPVVDQGQVAVPHGALADDDRDALRRIVGDSYVDDGNDARLRCAGGQSYTDLIRRRSGTGVAVPDAVVRPAGHDQALAVLALCSERRIAVVPFGGGTSVVGGVEPERGGHRAVVALELSRMRRLLGVDAVSRTATFEAGVTGPEAEALLEPHGLTLGHVPQSFERATLGGYVATRSAGQASTGYGRIDDLVVAVRMATPVGELAAGTGTPNAAGPDLRRLILGSEGTLGVVTEVTLRVRPRPEQTLYETFAFPSFSAGVGALRAMVQAGVAADVVRLSDEAETEVTLMLSGRRGQAAALLARLRRMRTPAFCVLGWEGDPAELRRRRGPAVAAIREADGIRIGRQAGEAWRRHRFSGPYQRDLLLDAGVLAETLETATLWSGLMPLYQAVRSSLVDALEGQGTPPIVMAHVSHLYPTGGSLYFTVLARQLGGPAETLEQWTRAKEAASQTIVEKGGTITHHHGVGRDHAPYLPAEAGDLGVSVLAAVKRRLDPHGILNPGVLVGGRDLAHRDDQS